MKRRLIKEMVEVMQAYNEGKQIESRAINTGVPFGDCYSPNWDWSNYDFRVKPEPATRPMTLDEIIEWRKNSNGVILWEDMLTTVDNIDLNKAEKFPIHIGLCNWISAASFVISARKADGSKFEVKE